MFIISSDTTIIGEIRSAGEVHIEGRIEGIGYVEGTVFVSESGVWKGRITADRIIVAGTIEGDVIAHNRLEVMPSARLNGLVVSPVISIAKGARVNGDIRMKLDSTLGLFVPKGEASAGIKETGDMTKQPVI